MRITYLVLALLLCAASLPAQSSDFPQKDSLHFPEDKDYHVDYPHHRFWCKVDGAWKQADLRYVNAAREWEGHYYVSTGDMKALVDRQGRILLGPSHWINKFEELILGYVCGKGTYLLSAKGDTLAFKPGGEDKVLRASTPTVNGQSAVCLAQYVQGLRDHGRDKIKAWGMINGKGRWVIPPDFDQPFKFENGVAQVFQKGKELWINEQGEPVEAPALPEEPEREKQR